MSARFGPEAGRFRRGRPIRCPRCPRQPSFAQSPSSPPPPRRSTARTSRSARCPTRPPPTPRLEIPAYDLSAALALERELGVSHVLAQVLVRRGLSEPAAARAFLEPAGRARPERVRRDRPRARGDRAPHRPGQPDRRARRLRRRRRVRHRDHGPRAAGARRRRRLVPARPAHRRLRAVARAPCAVSPTRGTGLLVTVDCAITAVDEVAAARAAGLDVVVTDHHAPRADGRLPDCAIVHPGVCGYPCPELCGTGVAYKLAQALGAPGAEDDLELVALATVADLMPLVGENRRLVREGLRALARTARPGLRALMAASGRRPERARHRRARLPAGAADQRRRPAAPRRRRARAAADRRRAASRRRSRPSSSASTPSAARSSSGSCGRPRPRSPSWASAARTCSPARAGIPAWSGSSPRGSSSATTGPRWSWSRSTETSGSGSARSIPGFDLLGRRCTRAPSTSSATAATGPPRA